MSEKNIYLGKAILNSSSDEINGQAVEIEGEKFYKISNYDQMPDFFMTIVSDSDHWMYISSNGSLSAGRKNRDNALFPYYTVDKIHDYRKKTGSKTIFLVTKDSIRYLWEPFTEGYRKVYRIERNIYKSFYGNKLIYEELNHDLGLSFKYGWFSSERFGWIKKAELASISSSDVKIELIDGITNILPYGADFAFQNEYSNLLDAYKRNELLKNSKLGLFALSSIPVDKAEPSEALKATTVWSIVPFSGTKYLISDKQLESFKTGQGIENEFDILASRGAYYICSEHALKIGEKASWYIVADVNKDSSELVNLDSFIKENQDLTMQIEEDITRGNSNLIKIVGGADGIQSGNDKLVNARHFSNTLFNIMRGGIFSDNYSVDSADFKLFVSQCNKGISEQFADKLALLPSEIEYSKLLDWTAVLGNPELIRISYEYLPLTFSRRHGDPSRPWNQFSIETKNEDGSQKLSYQGNWRDIFQNWEALTMSFPTYIESLIAKFVNASTPDGYNPYRITRKGIDWECPDPDDPWAYIGYWGDHQIIYLQKFLEQSKAYHPGQLDKLLVEEIFVYANVPYRIKTIEHIIKDPKDTIVFDDKLNRKIQNLTLTRGSDGKLLEGKSGNPYRVNLMEKILCSLLSKLSNFIPEAGIWLNTQRPEWNDANNALVGNGASMVTLYYLRRSLKFWEKEIDDSANRVFNISEELNILFESIFFLFQKNISLLNKGFSDSDRYSLCYKLGKAGSAYRESIYRYSFTEIKSELRVERLKQFINIALAYLDQSIEKNRRPDGLFHAYNLVSFVDKTVSIRYLYEMLEGQVAVLSSAYLNSEESLKVLDALRESTLYRRDQNSFLLYPWRDLPGFTSKNNIPNEEIDKSRLLQKLLKNNDTSIVIADKQGNIHFNGAFRNEDVLNKALDKLDTDLYGKMLKDEKESVMDLYESVFDHQSFTGRSGTFYGYEGIGSIYWHMVSKLLLATRETYQNGEMSACNSEVLKKIRDHYYQIREGLGVHKSPELHGAFPIDAYSHTPANSGAKQPGLTGQVKEDIISRFGELGVIIEKGTISFSPTMLNISEFLTEDSLFKYFNTEGKEKAIELHKKQLAFTFCQVPVIYTKGTNRRIEIEFCTGEKKVIEGSTIDKDTSNKIFTKSGEVSKIAFSSTL